MRSFACLATAFAAAVLVAGIVPGQAVAEAGPSSRQIAQRPPAPRPDSAFAPARGEDRTSPGVATLPVRGFRFLGNTRIPEAGLQAVVRPWVGRRVGIADLHRARQAVASAYRDRGWVAQTLLPRQGLDDGIVTIEVIEDLSSGIRVDSPSPDRSRPDGLRRRPDPRPQAGDLRDPLRVGVRLRIPAPASFTASTAPSTAPPTMPPTTPPRIDRTST